MERVSERRHRRQPASARIWTFAIVATLAWGAAAFGAVYPWGYRPLLTLCACLGLAGLWLGRDRSLERWLAVSLALVTAAVIGQLIRLPSEVIAEFSPHALRIRAQHDVGAALGVSDYEPLSIDPVRTRLGLSFLIPLSVLLVGVARSVTQESARWLAVSVVILSTCLAITGIVQAATFNGKVYGFWPLTQGGIPFGPFINRNHFAGWMLMALPLACGLFTTMLKRSGRQMRSWRDRLIWFSSPEANKALLTAFGILAMALALVMTMSRSGISTFVLTTVVGLFVATRNRLTRTRRIVLAGLFAVLLVVVVAWAGAGRLVDRFLFDADALGDRPAIWADTARVARDFWLTGTGLNTYGVISLYYQTSVGDEHVREAHNDYLQLAAEGGLLLVIPVAATVGVLVSRIKRRLRQDVGSSWWIRCGAAVGLISIAVQSTVEFSLQIPANAMLFCVLSAIALYDGTSRPRNPAKPSTPLP